MKRIIIYFLFLFLCTNVLFSQDTINQLFLKFPNKLDLKIDSNKLENFNYFNPDTENKKNENYILINIIEVKFQNEEYHLLIFKSSNGVIKYELLPINNQKAYSIFC